MMRHLENLQSAWLSVAIAKSVEPMSMMSALVINTDDQDFGLSNIKNDNVFESAQDCEPDVISAHRVSPLREARRSRLNRLIGRVQCDEESETILRTRLGESVGNRVDLV